MTNKVHVRTDDNVIVIAGKDSGKAGKVVKADPAKGRVFVSGVNMVKKHQKARGQNKPAGIIEREGSIDASNVMIVCPKCGKPTRVAHKIAEDGNKVRVCKKCGAQIDKSKKAAAKATTAKAAPAKAVASKEAAPKETAAKAVPAKKPAATKTPAAKADATKAAATVKKAAVKKETVKADAGEKVTKAKTAKAKEITETEKGE